MRGLTALGENFFLTPTWWGVFEGSYFFAVYIVRFISFFFFLLFKFPPEVFISLRTPTLPEGENFISNGARGEARR